MDCNDISVYKPELPCRWLTLMQWILRFHTCLELCIVLYNIDTHMCFIKITKRGVFLVHLIQFQHCNQSTMQFNVWDTRLGGDIISGYAFSFSMQKIKMRFIFHLTLISTKVIIWPFGHNNSALVFISTLWWAWM